MKITIVASDGRSPGHAIKDVVMKHLRKMKRAQLSKIPEAVAGCIKEWFAQRFPGSRHWSPDKVTHKGNTVVVSVPGVSRAYHDVDIYPKNAVALSIPIHPDAKGKPPSVFANLFHPKGTNVLARNEGGSLVAYYALASHVHQKQDRTIMPSDQAILDAAAKAALDAAK